MKSKKYAKTPSNSKKHVKYLNNVNILNSSKLSDYNYKQSDIYLFNISNVELEFYNLDLSICINNINKLKKSFRLLDKKEIYWKNKERNLNNLIN